MAKYQSALITKKSKYKLTQHFYFLTRNPFSLVALPHGQTTEVSKLYSRVLQQGSIDH
jgi:hypothetical protein